MKQKTILTINGPNLNLLGEREPEIYGSLTYDELIGLISKRAGELGLKLLVMQSSSEAELIDYIHQTRKEVDGLIINPGALTHTSIALRDALLAVRARVIEVHIGNIHAREKFRRRSYLSDIAIGVITGLGASGYLYALDWFAADFGQSK